MHACMYNVMHACYSSCSCSWHDISTYRRRGGTRQFDPFKISWAWYGFSWCQPDDFFFSPSIRWLRLTFMDNGFQSNQLQKYPTALASLHAATCKSLHRTLLLCMTNEVSEFESGRWWHGVPRAKTVYLWISRVIFISKRGWTSRVHRIASHPNFCAPPLNTIITVFCQENSHEFPRRMPRHGR